MTATFSSEPWEPEPNPVPALRMLYAQGSAPLDLVESKGYENVLRSLQQMALDDFDKMAGQFAMNLIFDRFISGSVRLPQDNVCLFYFRMGATVGN